MRRKTNKKFAFPKTERLHSQKLITELFSQKNDERSSTVFLYPFKVLILQDVAVAATPNYPQLLISVPKRVFRRAVHRNRLKRQIKEIYRVAKHEFPLEYPSPYVVGILYVGKKAEPFQLLEHKLRKALYQVTQIILQQKN